MSKILFYFSDHGANAVRQSENLYGGVGYYRVVKVAEQVKGHDVTVWGTQLTKKGESKAERWERIFKEYDIFWSSYFSDGEEASALFYTRDKLNREGKNKKVVLDVDDNFLDILESHPLYDKIKSGKKDRAFMSTILSFADVITVSTEPLKLRFAKHFRDVYKIEKEIVVIPNMNDIKDWNFTVPKKKNKIIIGYAGSNSHQDDLKMFIPNLLEVMKKHKNVYFECIGSITKDMLHLFKDFPSHEMNRCDIGGGTHTFKEYPEYIASRGWDIGVAPLDDNAFTRCKSHIKFMEYAALHIPVIASMVHPYCIAISDRYVIEQDKTGLLVKPSEWEEALETLITNAEKRKELAENAHKHITDNWQYDDGLVSERIAEVLSKLK